MSAWPFRGKSAHQSPNMLFPVCKSASLLKEKGRMGKIVKQDLRSPVEYWKLVRGSLVRNLAVFLADGGEFSSEIC